MARQVWQTEDGETFETLGEAQRHEATLRLTPDDQEFDSEQQAMMRTRRKAFSWGPWSGRARVVTTPGASPAPPLAWGGSPNLLAVDWDPEEISRALCEEDAAPHDLTQEFLRTHVAAWLREYEAWAMATPDPAAAMADMARQFGLALKKGRERGGQ